MASPALHLVLGCQHLPSCSFIPQATRRWQSCVAQLVSLCPCRGETLAVAWLGLGGDWDGFSYSVVGMRNREESFTLVGRMGKLGQRQPALRDNVRVT